MGTPSKDYRLKKVNVLEAVNLGNDTDTTGAITGGLAVLVYGVDNIPKHWIEVLARRDEIINFSICILLF